MSRRQAAKVFGIITPSGEPNGSMVKMLIDGYVPAREDTLKRCGLLPEPKAPSIPDEPIRRVLIGAWKLRCRWVSPEEYFGARS